MYLANKVTISLQKIILQREKEHCTIFINAYFKVGFMVRLGAKLGC